jgi:hypothetical protein
LAKSKRKTGEKGQRGEGEKKTKEKVKKWANPGRSFGTFVSSYQNGTFERVQNSSSLTAGEGIILQPLHFFFLALFFLLQDLHSHTSLRDGRSLESHCPSSLQQSLSSGSVSRGMASKGDFGSGGL